MRSFQRARSAGPDALLLLVAAVWGGSYLAAKELVAVVGVDVALALRYGSAALAMLVLLACRRKRVVGLRIVWVGIGLGLTQAGVLWLETAGVALTSATNAGLLISLSLLFTPVLETLVLGRRLPVSFYLVTVVAILGIALLVSSDGFRAPSSGDLLVLAAAAVRAVHVTVTARVLRPGDDLPTVITLQMLTGVLLAGLVAWPQIPEAVAAMDAAAWGAVAFLGLACSVFAFLVQTWAIRRTSAARAAMLLGTEPLWALGIGVALGGDRLGAPHLVGAALVVASTVLGTRIERRARESADRVRAVRSGVQTTSAASSAPTTESTSGVARASLFRGRTE